MDEIGQHFMVRIDPAHDTDTMQGLFELILIDRQGNRDILKYSQKVVTRETMFNPGLVSLEAREMAYLIMVDIVKDLKLVIDAKKLK